MRLILKSVWEREKNVIPILTVAILSRKHRIQPAMELLLSNYQSNLNPPALGKAQSTPAAAKKQVRTERGNTPDYLVFSGSSKDPEVYLKWEADMKKWLKARSVPKEEKLSYALDMLIGKAYTWWKQEDAQTYYSNPVLSWGDLKGRMYREKPKF
ncbi:unnamed protein product [Eruca vesicaria subsp. sativa]|uniref:Uncharacterized protein n=1 Tax=Eruca vesicaria subsp. sativa TaxID=29727 RepID=A0ABC8KPW9_ERUVS|nr:unnamed protein product [Eruca vesicaria subsp. sativa]